MKALILGIIFSSSLVFAFQGGNGGDVVNNGGGLSEQAIMFSVQNYRSFAASCLRYESCGLREPMQSYMKNVHQCSLPSAAAVRFATPAEDRELVAGKAYAVSANGALIVNREELYTDKGEPLRVSGAFAHMSRIYFDLCGSLPFAQSASLAKVLAQFAEAEGEQVTIGKDSIKLPSTKWIRVRTMYSDLLIESPKSLLRLSCGENLNTCTLAETAEAKSSARFKNLSLAQESLRDGLLSFEVQGVFISSKKERQEFKLFAEYLNGDVLSLKLQGQSLELPKP